MSTIKSFTDLSQSKKLAEILPLESADMCWTKYIDNGDITSIHATVNYGIVTIDYPCWSLAALLSVIRRTIGYTLHGVNNVYMSCELGDFKKIETEVYDNEVDACYEMIVRLNELKRL